MNEKGCSFLDKGIDFELDKVCDCCITHNDGRGMPLLFDNYHGELINWEELFNKKAERIAAQKQNTIYDCENCYHLLNYQFTNERKIKDFHFSHCRACNAACIYCSDAQSGGIVNYDVFPVIKDLIDKGYYEPGGEATLQGGEPTLMQNFDELVYLLTENGTNIRVHTSGIKFSPSVENALKQNKAAVVISLDCGSKDTYRKIKQIDAFETVCENISKYVSASKSKSHNVLLKYIIIPGVNDNLKEIDNFFDLIKKLNITDIALDIEVQYAREYNNKDVSPHIFLLVDYFNKLVKKNNINILIYSFLSYVLQNRNIKPSGFIKYKPLFNWYLNTKINSQKNLKYYR